MDEIVKDPVCGMELEKDTAEGNVAHMGKTFFFCSEGCKNKFEKDPMKYMNNDVG